MKSLWKPRTSEVGSPNGRRPGKRGGRDGRNEEKREENGREVQGKNIEMNHTREGKENTRGQDARIEESFRAFTCFHTCYWSLVP